MPYAEEDMLMLSGIQHYAFCPRQWALIHIEQQWNDNVLTTEGQILHKHVDDPFYRQKNGDIICLRSVCIASKELGLYGVSDMIELYPSASKINAITHPKYPGFWAPFPIEYKRGRPKRDDIDLVQLVAQAMCIEEQYGIKIPAGAIFYGETRRRVDVEFTQDLRDAVKNYSAAMHEMFQQKNIPSAERKPYCNSCSMKDICMPDTARGEAASQYLKEKLYEKIA